MKRWRSVITGLLAKQGVRLAFDELAFMPLLGILTLITRMKMPVEGF